MLLTRECSIPGDLGIHFKRPAVDAAGHGLGGFHTLMSEPVGNIEAAHAVVAEADDFVVRIELLQIRGYGAHGDEYSAIDPTEGVFVRFADVDEEELVATVEALFDFASRDFEIVHCRLPRRNV
jgi:hypothetical protein